MGKLNIKNTFCVIDKKTLFPYCESFEKSKSDLYYSDIDRALIAIYKTRNSECPESICQECWIKILEQQC